MVAMVIAVTQCEILTLNLILHLHSSHYNQFQLLLDVWK